MSNWRVNEEPPADFLDLLFDEEEREVVEESGDEELFDDEDDEVLRDPSPERMGSLGNFPQVGEEWDLSLSPSPEAPPYSPLTSPERPARRLPQMDASSPRPTASRDRSRSPIFGNSSSQSDCLIRIFGEDGQPLDARMFAVDDQPEDDDAENYLSPDAHALYVSPEVNDSERNDSERNDREAGERRVSRRRGGRRGVRGQNAGRRGYPNRGRRGNNRWDVGHPLTEIWTNDEDVPPELVSLVTDVLRRRQMGMQGAARAESERRNVREDDSESENVDEFFDANDGADGLPRLEGQNLHFEWSTMESFQGQEENFRPERTGSVHVYNSAYDAFRSYWGDDILGLIVAETNLYATKIRSAAFQSDWYPTNIHEILCLFAFWMMLGIVRMPTVYSCFSVDPLLKTEVFRRIFTRRRYELLSRALHFVDSDPAVNRNPSNVSAASSSDELYRLRPIIDHLNSCFQANYILHKDICIDESLTLWKGRLTFRQYIQNKAAKFGIKTFELCESTTGYLWSFIVYAGKQSATDLEQAPGVLKSTAVVKKLISPLLNKGYRLFMDNWYNSPLLARFLKLNGTDCVGTLRPSRRDVPILINKAPLKRGEFIARHSGDVSILSWQDKKRVTMISTCHGSSTALPTVPSRPPYRPAPFKPQVVLDYNKFMGGVDMKDQMLEPYLIERKRCTKWYMKLFKRLLNVSILNARILLESSAQKRHDHLGFRLHLVDSILTNHLSHCPQHRRSNVSITRSTHQQPRGFISFTHWPAQLEPPSFTAGPSDRNYRKRCTVCLREGRKSQRTLYCCETCKVPLCIRNCFKSYHTPR